MKLNLLKSSSNFLLSVTIIISRSKKSISLYNTPPTFNKIIYLLIGKKKYTTNQQFLIHILKQIPNCQHLLARRSSTFHYSYINHKNLKSDNYLAVAKLYYLAEASGILSRKSCSITDSSCAIFNET